ncbi:ABC transporter substrate-binding protein [Bradyrhizobium zhanjiangense]|nr:ABC transporter substrate-binding protein [Bradyrhizobium zhanjiangense]
MLSAPTSSVRLLGSNWITMAMLGLDLATERTSGGLMLQNYRSGNPMLQLLRTVLRVSTIGALMLLALPASGETLLRVGHFPNITHIQGLVAHALSRQGKGFLEPRLGLDVKIEWFVYNAGPSAMEAIFAKSIDFTYVGPNPAINAYAKARGEGVRIIAGAAEGGSALVIHSDSSLKTAADFRGKIVATPQLGNTQDVVARAWLKGGGLKITQTGGDATVLPTANPDQLLLFKQRQVDAVWTVEPWISRLELEAGGKVLVDDRSAITTVLVASAALVKAQPELARKFAAAHRELTEWIIRNPAEAQKLAREELFAETRTEFPDALLKKCWDRLTLTPEIAFDVLKQSVSDAQAAGFLRDAPDMTGLIAKP